MSLPDITALAGLIISALVFILLASRTKSSVFTLRGYTMAENEVVGDQYGASFVAASSSLATVLLFFLSNAKYYGLILLWCGATYLIGQYIFTQYVRKKDVIKDDVRTVADLWFYTIKSKSIARLITALTFATFLMILFIELYVGSAIFSYFFSPFTVYSDEISFLTVGLIVVYYVRIGGLKAVVQTDGWQLVLMLGAVAALFAFALVSPSESSFDFGAFLSVNASKLELIAFCIWILIINLSLPFTQLSSWQRVAAC